MVEPSKDDYRIMRAERKAGKSKSSTDAADMNVVQGTAFRLQTPLPPEFKLSSLLQAACGFGIWLAVMLGFAIIWGFPKALTALQDVAAAVPGTVCFHILQSSRKHNLL